MAAKFPNEEWLQNLVEKLNSDDRYAQIARNWEGDLLFEIEPDGPLSEKVYIYLDLWHGKCRDAYVVKDQERPHSAYILKAPYGNFVRVLKGELDPMQAMVTRRLKVQGSMSYMMRNVPVVLDFVRCAREVTTDHL